MPISRDISHKILCLPMFPELKEEQQKNIIEIVINNL
jgi:dTDP-4-amino-4,6-dideoxygalactose transaminase